MAEEDDIIKLTGRQEKACRKFVEGADRSEAYRHAYSCDNMKLATVNRRASELFSMQKIKDRVRQLSIALEEEHKITKEKVLFQLKSILDSKITDYCKLVTTTVKEPIRDKKGNITEAGLVEYEKTILVFKDFDELTKEQILAIESVKQTQFGIELKLHGKSWTIERISKLLGYDMPAKTATTDPNGEALPTNITVEVVTTPATKE